MPPTTTQPILVAGVYAALGDKDEAFKILEKAIGEHQLLTPLKVEPPLESLHSDPRWKVLLRRMNFRRNSPGRESNEHTRHNVGPFTVPPLPGHG